MATERKEMFRDQPEEAYLYCIHCERAYPKGKFRVMSDIDFGLMQMCPYEDCRADAVLDAWEWEQIVSYHPDYPTVPEEGKIYPMYPETKPNVKK